MTVVSSAASPARRAQLDGEQLPRFRSSAADQLNGTLSGPLARARLRLRDAFTPSQPVSDPQMFAGRGGLLASMIRAIEDHKMHVVLFGDRGTGKTSLLHVLARQATEARYLVHYASCGEEASFSDMFRAVALDIPLLFHSGYSPTAAETERGATLGSLLPEGTVTPRQISDLFAKLTGTRLLVILDEFDRSSPGTFRRSVAELVKNLSDRSIRVQLVIAGVAANLTELVEHIPSIRRNILGVPMPTMSPEEVVELLRNGERVSGVAFEPPAVEMIVSLSAGSPYIAGLLGQHAGLAAVDDGRASVAGQDVAAAIARAVDEIADRISERSRHCVERARKDGYSSILALLSHAALRHGGRFGADMIGERIASAEERKRTLQLLAEEYGLIEPIANDPDNRYRFIEEGVPIYLWMIEARDELRRP